METKLCLHCGDEFHKKPTVSRKQWATRTKYCSVTCQKLARRGKICSPGTIFKKGFIQTDGFRKGHTPWNKEKTGVMPTPWNKGKELPEIQGENNPGWKGDEANIKTKHTWVLKKLGKPQGCEVCHKSNKNSVIDMANIDHTYRRNLKDYMPMCRSCHRQYDILFNEYQK